jgi:hypothetical protein
MQAYLSPQCRKILTIFIVLAIGVGILWLFSAWQFISGDLINNLWAPAHLLVDGESPYHTQDLPPIEGVDWLPPVWLPPAIGLFFPLGWLTPVQASQLWLVSSVVLIVIMLWLAGTKGRPPAVLFGLSGLLVIMFPPIGRHLTLGQFTVLAAVMLLLAARLIVNPRYLLAGFLVAVSLAKPQIGLLVVPGLFVAFGRHHRLRGAILFAGALALWVLLLTIPLWIADPAWFRGFLTALRLNQEQEWVQPSLITLLIGRWGAPGWVLGGIVTVSLFCANIWLWLKRAPEEAVIWSLALTPFITPYIWSWDFVMLAPLMVYAIYRFQSKFPFALLGLAYLFCWRLMLSILVNTEGQESRFWWVPWLIVLSICSGFLVDARPFARFRKSRQRDG